MIEPDCHSPLVRGGVYLLVRAWPELRFEAPDISKRRSLMIRRVLTLVVPLTFLFCIEASAQTVDELVKKSIDARGGIQKLKAIKSIKASGKLTTQGIEIPVTLQQKRPALM